MDFLQKWRMDSRQKMNKKCEKNRRSIQWRVQLKRQNEKKILLTKCKFEERGGWEVE